MTGFPPLYSWGSASEKDHMSDSDSDVMRTIEDTLHKLDPELRQLSLDIHGEHDRTPDYSNRPDVHEPYRSP